VRFLMCGSIVCEKDIYIYIFFFFEVIPTNRCGLPGISQVHSRSLVSINHQIFEICLLYISLTYQKKIYLADCFNSQVAGLTNNSYLAESHEVRHCVQQYKILGEHVLQVAKVR
jgi:hypothetical protein